MKWIKHTEEFWKDSRLAGEVLEKFRIDSRDGIGRSWFDLASGSHLVLVQDGSWDMKDRLGRKYESRYRVFFKAAAGEYTELTRQVLAGHSTKGGLDGSKTGHARYDAVKKEAVEIIERLLEIDGGPVGTAQDDDVQPRSWWSRARSWLRG